VVHLESPYLLFPPLTDNKLSHQKLSKKKAHPKTGRGDITTKLSPKIQGNQP
jgi:hypothetical protein